MDRSLGSILITASACFLLYGCGGGGGGSSLPPVASHGPQAGSAPTPAATSGSSGSSSPSGPSGAPSTQSTTSPAPRGTAAPIVQTTASAAPVVAAAVTGTVVGLNTATQVNVNSPACGGYIDVNFSSSTPITYNGYTLNSVGAPISVWGSGSCASSYAATAIVLGSGATATPSPTTTPTTPPSTPPPATGVTDAAYASVVNPGPWPANFRPYCANASANPTSPCPWNDPLPDNPQQLYPNSASIVAGMFGASNAVELPGQNAVNADFNHPVYFASPTDPLVTVTCTSYCHGISSATFRVPSVAVPAGANDLTYSSLDRHMGVVEPDGTEYDIYDGGNHVWTPGASTETVVGLAQTSILAAGNIGMTDGASLAAGIPRFDELARGVVPHALFASTACVTGSVVYPGTSQGMSCSSGTGPPIGARFQLTLTDAQIDALANAYPWEKALLHAMHDYGVYIADTEGESTPGGGGATFVFRFESQTQYAAYGQTYPIPSAIANNIAHFDTLLNWANSLRIVSACYAQETCSQ